MTPQQPTSLEQDRRRPAILGINRNGADDASSVADTHARNNDVAPFFVEPVPLNFFI